MTCSCEAAGWCETYKKQQSARHVAICRGEVLTAEKCEAYRRNWAGLADGSLKPAIPDSPINAAEAAALFPDEDPTLLGNRSAALTAAIGIPPCGGCEQRKAWLNKAHAWLRGQ